MSISEHEAKVLSDFEAYEAEVATLRARVVEMERERDAVTACLAGREKHLGERIQTLIESGDLSARAVAFHADRAAEKEREIQRLYNVVCSAPACTAAIIRKDDGSRVCAAGHPARWVNVDLLTKAEADSARLREACADIDLVGVAAYGELQNFARDLDAISSADNRHVRRIANQLRERLERIDAALASAPSAAPTPRDMRVAEAVREAYDRAIIVHGRLAAGAIDLAAVVAKAVGT